MKMKKVCSLPLTLLVALRSVSFSGTSKAWSNQVKHKILDVDKCPCLKCLRSSHSLAGSWNLSVQSILSSLSNADLFLQQQRAQDSLDTTSGLITSSTCGPSRTVRALPLRMETGKFYRNIQDPCTRWIFSDIRQGMPSCDNGRTRQTPWTLQ